MTIRERLADAELGRYKAWFNRLQSYMTPVNFAMILYLYIIREPLGLVWYIWVICVSLVLTFLLIFDILFIFPSENKYTMKKNPEWVCLKEDINEIKFLLKKEFE